MDRHTEQVLLVWVELGQDVDAPVVLAHDGLD